MLQHNGSFFIADLQTNDRVFNRPVDQNVPVIDVEERQSRAVGIDLIREADTRFRVVAAGCICLDNLHLVLGHHIPSLTGLESNEHPAG